jgi:hypothetical protein
MLDLARYEPLAFGEAGHNGAEVAAVKFGGSIDLAGENPCPEG